MEEVGVSYWWSLWLIAFWGFYGRGFKDWRNAEPDERGGLYVVAALGLIVFVPTALIIVAYG